MLTISDLPQRVFDHLMQAISLLVMLHEHEIELIAKSLENPTHYGDAADRASGEAMATIVRSHKEKV